MNKPSLEDINALLNKAWSEVFKDTEISIYHGPWSEEDKNITFQAKLEVNGRIEFMTGPQGFLNLIDTYGDLYPLKYNGKIVPKDKLKEFTDYCKKLING